MLQHGVHSRFRRRLGEGNFGHPIRITGKSRFLQIVSKATESIGAMLCRGFRADKADVLMAVLMQIPGCLEGSIIIVHFHHRKGRVRRQMGIHANKGDILPAKLVQQHRIIDLVQNDTIAVLAANRFHDLFTGHILINQSKDNAVA